MSSVLQKLYWKCPYFVKEWAASVNALWLDRFRHSAVFQQLCNDIAERDNWSIEQIFAYQQQQLRLLIQHAAANVPYYRKMFSETAIDPNTILEPEDLRQLPILEKELVRADPFSFVDEALRKTKLLTVHTSGTTGTPLELYRDVRLSSAVSAYRDRRWHAVAGMHRRVNPSVSISGHLIVAPDRNNPPFWVMNWRWKQLYMSSYHLSPENMDSYIGELRRFKADYLEGYPSSVYVLARYILDEKLDPIPFKACFTTAETLSDYQRQAITEAFCCRTYNQYGCGESVIFAAECEYGSMHLSPEVGLVEVVDRHDKPLPLGQTGQLICTSLINRVQPFIRYRLGDIGSLSADRCPCGSALPVLGGIDGRADDVLLTRNGRQIGRLDPVFKGTRGIIEAQIVQEDYDRFRVRVVPSQAYTEDDCRHVRDGLLARVGHGHVQIEIVHHIERTSGGKFKAVVNNIPEQARL